MYEEYFVVLKVTTNTVQVKVEYLCTADKVTTTSTTPAKATHIV